MFFESRSAQDLLVIFFSERQPEYSSVISNGEKIFVLTTVQQRAYTVLAANNLRQL
jgi:hypothetical protein